MTCFTLQRWGALSVSAGIERDSEEFFLQMERRYSEPHRAYHNARHIDECLREFDFVRGQAMNPTALELAIWFHDVIYDPRALDNEEQSARFAKGCLKKANSALADQVSKLILTTESHRAGSIEDAGLLIDIDLSILGKSDERFAQFEAGIEKEYAWVPREAYREKRAEILGGFLNRERIFATESFHNRYEATARRNIAKLIAELRGKA
jgi:predicted metal-dependent HD superfamily phosphohydrolase